jgi:hypothetical protein
MQGGGGANRTIRRTHSKSRGSRVYFLLEKYMKVWFFAPFFKICQSKIIVLSWTLFYESYNA